MRKKFTVFMTIFALLVMLALPSSMSAQKSDQIGEWVAVDQNYSNQQQVTAFEVSEWVNGAFAKSNGSTAPAYYSTNSGVRLYAHNTISIAPVGDKTALKEIRYTFYKQGTKAYATASLISGEGEFVSGGTPSTTRPVEDVWSGSSTGAVIIKLGGSGQRVVTRIQVTASVGGSNVSYTLTYDANGGAGEMTDPNSPYSHGALVTVLPNGFSRDGYVFDRWTTVEHPEGSFGYSSYIPGNTFTIYGNTTLYAQWVDVTNGVLDALTPTNVNEAIGESTGYSRWTVSFRTGESAVSTFEGLTCKNADAIQMTNSTSGASRFSGIVTTQSKGRVSKVNVLWDANTIEGRTMQVYGRNTPYSGVEDLYGTNQGTLLGTIVKGTSTELIITDEYEYIGLRSASNAMYLDEIRVVWQDVESVSAIDFSPVAINLGNVLADTDVTATFMVAQNDLGAQINLTASQGELNTTVIPRNAGATEVIWTGHPTTEGQQTVTITATSIWDNDTVTNTLPITMTVLSTANAVPLSMAKYNFLNNGIAEAVIDLTNVEVIGKAGQYLYLQDAAAGILVYGTCPDSLNILKTGDKFRGGVLMGTFTYYHDVVELIDFAFQNVSWTSDNALTAVSVSSVSELIGLNHTYEHRYVSISDLSITINTSTDYTVWIATKANDGSISLYDMFSVGYATKTPPDEGDLFTVKGLYNPFYANGQSGYEIDPTTLNDIHTSKVVDLPTFYPSIGISSSTPSLTTTAILTPAVNTTMVYHVDRDNGYESTDPVVVNITGPTTITAYSTRDFYTDSPSKTSYYALPSYVRPVTFNANGVDVSAVYVGSDGKLYDYQCPVVDNLGDFTFRGWSTDVNGTETITFPYVVTESMTLYAVYGKCTMHAYNRINNVSGITEGEYVIIGRNGQAFYVLKNERASSTPQAFSLSSLGITIANGVLNGDLEEVTWNFVGNLSEMEINSTANNVHYLYAVDNAMGVRVGFTQQAWTISEDVYLSGTFNLMSNEVNRYLTLYNEQSWRCYYASDMYGSNCYPRLMLYKKMPVSQDGDTRYTRVFMNETATGEINIVGPSVVPSGSFLDMDGRLFHCNDADLFLIEDGATFKPSGNDGIKATVKKNIKGYLDEEAMNGWHMFTSPVGEVNAYGVQVNNTDGVALNLANDDFDLYVFDESQIKEWRNFEEDSALIFGNGKGVLYASKQDRTLTFAGTLTPSVSYPLAYSESSEFCGWNLVGNPFTCDAYLTGCSSYFKLVEVIEDGVARSAYQLVTDMSQPIGAMEAVFVQAEDINQSISFVKSIGDGNGNGRPVVNLSVGNSVNVIDKASVFVGQGGMMSKMTFDKTIRGTQLYLQQSDKDYAVLCTQAEGEIPVNFKAAYQGNYTLTVDTKQLEMDYLHLIDNLTGADIDLLVDPSYTFDARPLDYASRFRLVFNSTSTDPESVSFAYYNGSQWVVSNIGEATLQVIDVMGRVLSTEAINGNTEVSLSYKPGVYMLRLVNGNDVKVQKVIIK